MHEAECKAYLLIIQFRQKHLKQKKVFAVVDFFT